MTMELMHEIPEKTKSEPTSHNPLLTPFRLLARLFVFIHNRPVAFVVRTVVSVMILASVLALVMNHEDEKAIQSILDNPKLSSAAKIEKLARQFWGDTFQRMEVTDTGKQGGHSAALFSTFGSDAHYSTTKVGLLKSMATHSIKNKSLLLFRYAHKLGLEKLTVSLAIPLYTDAIHMKPVEVFRVSMPFAAIQKIDGWDDGSPSSETLKTVGRAWTVELDRWKDVTLTAQAH